MDRIEIKDLEIYARHGVLKEENVLGQKFLVSLTMFLDAKKAGHTDAMEDSVSYAEVAHFVDAYLREHTFKLLEAAAEHLAEEILLRFPLLEKVDVTIKKPWAPILLPMDTVSVSIEREWHTAYIALGSNMGDKHENVKRAIELLNQNEKVRVSKVSALLETEPMGEVVQDDYLNGVVEIRTLLAPEELLDFTSSIEQELKRVRKVHWGPRTIDLDIIFYDEIVYRSERLIIPHPGVAERDFVLVPLEEIAPMVKHPLLNKSVFQLKNELERSYIR